MNQLIRRTCELCKSDIPGVGIIHVAPRLIFHGVVCSPIIPDENVDYGSRDPFCGDAHFFKFLKNGLNHPQSSSSPYPYTVFLCLQYNHFITGRIIRELREQRGLTQEVLSGLAAVSRSHLAEIETGHTNANVETLWKISEALGMKMSDLIRMVEQAIERGG